MAGRCIKWGIAGCGRIANDFTLALRALPPDEHKVTTTLLLNVIITATVAQKAMTLKTTIFILKRPPVHVFCFS